MDTNGFLPVEENENFDLAQFDDDFEAAEIDTDTDPIEDGKYQVIVDKVEITKSQASGNSMLKWTLRIIAPKHIGRLIWKNNMIVTSENVKWLKQDLYTCGLKLSKLSELPLRLSELLNLGLEITKRTKGENENVFFNRKIEITPESDEPVEAGLVF